MSELSYKELQEQGVFDVPYRAFEYIQSQQAKIDELQGRINEALKSADINFWNSSTVKDMVDILKGNKDEN